MDQHKVIIVIGLPASGKTNYINSFITANQKKNYTVFDDFITTFYDGEAIKALKGLKEDKDKTTTPGVILIDPRLCMYDIFERYIKRIIDVVNLNDSNDSNDILLILFENNPEQCYNNVKRRIEEDKDSINNNKNIGLENTIKQYSSRYKIENYITAKNSFNYKIIPVWAPSF